jgi:hypothetical protein
MSARQNDNPNLKCKSPGCPFFCRLPHFVCSDHLERGERVAVLALPEDHAARKGIPITTGALDYFPAAVAAVAELSRIGNERHNPGEPMHHARGKSTDHADCIVRHLLDRGQVYEVTIAGKVHRVRHSVAVAWRALALAQEELEREEGAPLARGAKEGEPRAGGRGLDAPLAPAKVQP